MSSCALHTEVDAFELPSPLGVIQAQLLHDRLQHITLGAEAGAAAAQPLSCAGRTVARWLRSYLQDATAVSCAQHAVGAGTAFQQRVWQALCAIPTGETRSYGELAKELGSVPRAVGQVCRRNPLPIWVPCHRVVAANGMGGYDGVEAGPVLQRKQWLLQHEGVRL